MKTFLLALAIAGAIGAPSAFARPFLFFGRAKAVQSARVEAPIGRDGQDTRQVCSAQNPNIEYRDCVNATTRDPNAKVRMG